MEQSNQAIPAPMTRLVLSRDLLEVLIRAGLITALVVFCYRVFHPFLDLLLWSMILAVTLFPLHRMIRARMGNRDGRAATVLVIVSIVVLIVPVYLLAVSMTDSLRDLIGAVRSGSLHVPPPGDAVASWPLVGKRVHAVWLQAATDLTGMIQAHAPKIKQVSLVALEKIAGLGLGLLLFFVALILAGIFMAYGESGKRSAVRNTSRIFGPARGPHVADLCTATIRAVAQGVVGIAFIQMLLVGLGLALLGVPGTGILALAVLLLGIVQLPATLITVPVIIFVFATEGTSVATIVFGVYVFIAGLVDNVLKPLLLGRGVDVPMPVVLIGALGGMVTNGIIGLFIGPVVLAVGWELFWQWVDNAPPELSTVQPPPELAVPASPPA
jgi:predicted PurR-regulated permease PerM